MPILRLAWRNLFRHRQRTALLGLVVAYVTVAVLFLYGFLDGYGESLVEAYGAYLVAPVVVARTAWWEDPDPAHGLTRLPVLSHPRVQAQTPRLRFAALVRSPYRTEGLEVVGVHSEGERGLSRLAGKVVQGRWMARRGEVVLGERLARRLDVRVGERLVVETSGRRGPQALGLQVVGILRAGVSTVDHSGLYIPLEDAQGLTGIRATELAVRVPRGWEMRAAEELNRVLSPELRAKGVWELMGPIRYDYEASRLFYIPIVGLFMLLAAVAVTSTTYVSVRERLRELSVMESLGMSPGRLAAMVALEAFLASLVGLVGGLLLGYGLLLYTSAHNVFGPLMRLSVELLPESGLTEALYTAVRPHYALYAATTVVLSTLLAFLFPSRLVVYLNVPRYLKEV
ncbi:MAG: ABC transporter permease [Armatimonadetes bacterium]|nr:ABC transporter permease [Armatimonadota bacterium]MDW8152909.1 FtsX-like permease family protein [Armatimonadota bacterium]